MDENKITLDEEAQALFDSFKGIEKADLDKNAFSQGKTLFENIREEQKKEDIWRINLIRLCHYISTYYLDTLYLRKKGPQDKIFDMIIETCGHLSKHMINEGQILIRFRGDFTTILSLEKYDYEIMYGNIHVDSSIASSIAERHGDDYKNLFQELISSFKNLSDKGIHNICLTLPGNSQDDINNLRASLYSLAQYHDASIKNTPIIVKKENKRYAIPVIKDEKKRPDINLTLMSALNILTEKSMNMIVQKIYDWGKKQSKIKHDIPYSNVFNLIFKHSKLSEKILKPLIEINNLKWLILSDKGAVYTEEKACVAQIAFEASGGSTQKIVDVINSVYGNDFQKINTAHLKQRIQLQSQLLETIEVKHKEQSNIKEEVLQNIHKRLDGVKDEIFDDLYVKDEISSDSEDYGADDKKKAITIVHNKLYKMVSFFKSRSATRKKMIGLINSSITFTQKDYETIASDFMISIDEAVQFIDKLKECFDTGGHFKKKVFIEHIDHFKKYEKKIFEFLWHHLKDVILKSDRIPFLNSLQMLTSKMNQPKKAFKILLEDFLKEPKEVNFSDNKAIMLANLMVHRYDKSLTDIEITPEDILMESHLLNEIMAKYASWRIEKEQERFYAKLKTIHEYLIDSLNQKSGHDIQTRTILNLEREIYIFLSLINNTTSRSVLRSGVREYGNPSSEIYFRKQSADNMSALLQNLRIAIHGLGSIGQVEDIPILETVKKKEDFFVLLKKTKEHRSQAKLITDWVNNAIKHIKYKA